MIENKEKLVLTFRALVLPQNNEMEVNVMARRGEENILSRPTGNVALFDDVRRKRQSIVNV